jgi:hypothetical protein
LNEGITTVRSAKRAFFPLDEQLGVSGQLWSEGLVREMVWLSGAASSYQFVEEIFARIGHLTISSMSAWRMSQAVGSQVQKMSEKGSAEANRLPQQEEAPVARQADCVRMGVALDGFMLHLREEGWKECKLADLYEVAVRPAVDEETGEVVERAHAVKQSYVAHLGGPEVMGELAWAEAQRRGWDQAADTQVLGDGAVWIWNQAALHFGDSHQLVDWYHAKTYLLQAAKLLHAEGSSAYPRWLNQHETLLYQGHAASIAKHLLAAATANPANAEAFTSVATYFQHNHRRMNYLEMRELEWPIGSGMVESGAKQYKARFSGTGMRWSRSGAQNLLPIRSAILSRTFDQLFAAAIALPPT